MRPDTDPYLTCTATSPRFHTLSAVSVSRIYGDLPVVQEASLSLEPGTVTALLGASGAGKSTLLRLIAGLEPVDSGEIRFGDTLWSAPGQTVPAEKRRIGLIFQDFALFPHLSLQDNVRFGLAGMTRAEGRARAVDWLERVGLAHRAKAFPHELSGGEQQRVAIARALAPEPVAVLMDEPFSGLDPALREDIREMTLDVVASTGAPALFVTHDPEEAMSHADQLGVMRGGRLIQIGTPDSLYHEPVDTGVAAALGPVSILPAGRVSGGRVETPIGAFDTPGIADGTETQLVLREAALTVGAGTGDGGVDVVVDRVAFAGTHSHVHVRIAGQPVLIYGPSRLPDTGTGSRIEARLDRSLAYVFPVER